MSEVHTDDDGTVWVDRDGNRYLEVRRIDGDGMPKEVCLSPEGTPALRGWWTWEEMSDKGMRQDGAPGTDGYFSFAD